MPLKLSIREQYRQMFLTNSSSDSEKFVSSVLFSNSNYNLIDLID